MTNPNTGKVPLTIWVDPPPKGMEWKVSEFIPQREYYAGKMVTIEAVLRPIQPATVMVEMTREDAEWIKRNDGSMTTHHRNGLVAAIAAALARKPDAKPCPVMVHLPISGSRFAVCINEYDKTRRPCKLAEGHGGEHE